MSRLMGNLYCFSLNFTDLNENNLRVLEQANIPFADDSLNRLRTELGFHIDQLAVIQKCNAVMIIISIHSQANAPNFIRNRVLYVWDKLSKGAITSSRKSIEIFENTDAVRYLGQCALGLHSVVIGDSQVHSQIVKGLKKAIVLQPESPIFSSLISWLTWLRKEVEKTSALMRGNVSLERIACDKIAESVPHASVAVVGLGQTGKLISEILVEEKGCTLSVSNRTQEQVDELAKKLQSHNVKVIPFDSLGNLADTDVLVFAVDSTFQTRELAKDIMSKLASGELHLKAVVDMTSPPIFDFHMFDIKHVQLISLIELSSHARRAVSDRKVEANKVRMFIDEVVEDAVVKFEEALAKYFISQQRRAVLEFRMKPELPRIAQIRDAGLRSIRSNLHDKGFVEIHTPYIVGISTDPPRVDKGTAFTVTWPSKNAFLRQSAQMYKQMLVISGNDKVFELGPFWRAEATRSHRHLEETIGLDVEVKNPSCLHDVYSIAYDVLQKVAADLRPFETTHDPLQLPVDVEETVITYSKAIEILNKTGHPIAFGEDLGIVGEWHLGQIFKQRNHVDAITIVKYPDTIKKFYTHQNDDGTTETFDIILCGWELVSGAIRETRTDNIERRMKIEGISPSQYDFYLALLKDAPPHGGFGMGFDRLIAKVMRYDEIAQAVLFPRTFECLIP